MNVGETRYARRYLATIMNAKEYAEYQQAVARYLEGIDALSAGACPGCAECGLPGDVSDHNIELAGEPHFSWAPCEICGSRLGGDRYPIHGVVAATGLVCHMTGCADCMYYVNYGRLDDRAMSEIGGSAE